MANQGRSKSPKKSGSGYGKSAGEWVESAMRRRKKKNSQIR